MRALFIVLCENVDKKYMSPTFSSYNEAEIFQTVFKAQERKKELEKKQSKGWTYKVMQIIPTEPTCEVYNS